MLGLSNAALHAALAEMKNKNPDIIELTEQEFRDGAKARGWDGFNIDISVMAMKAGAQVDAGNGKRIVLKKTDGE
jgi:hypothetical protein